MYPFFPSFSVQSNKLLPYPTPLLILTLTLALTLTLILTTLPGTLGIIHWESNFREFLEINLRHL